MKYNFKIFARLLVVFFIITTTYLGAQTTKDQVKLLLDSLRTNFTEDDVHRLSSKGLLLTQQKNDSFIEYANYLFIYHSLRFEENNKKAVISINKSLNELKIKPIYKKDSLQILFLLLRSDYEPFDEAKRSILKAQVLSHEKNINIDTYFYLYFLYTNNQIEEDILHWVDKSITISKVNKDSSNITFGYETKAKFYRQKKDYYRACIYYYLALNFSGRKNFERALIANNLSVLLSEIGNYDEALSYAYESLVCTKNDLLFNTRANTAIAELFLYKQQYDSIYKYARKAISQAKLTKKEFIISRNEFNIGVYFYYKNLNDSAIYYFQKSKYSAKNNTLLFYNDFYLAKIDVKNKNYRQAKQLLLPHLNNNYDASAGIQLNINVSNYYKLFSEVEEKLNNSNVALQYLKKHNAIQDSINLISALHRVNSANIKFALTKQKEEDSIRYNYEKQLLLKEYSFTKKKTIYILIILLVIILIIALSFWFYYVTKKNIAKTKSNQAKYKLLKTQLNPHFVSNAMSAIQGYILNSDKIVASNYISDFSKLTRLIFEKASKDFILLEDEITILKLFFELQTLRFPDKFSYEIKYDGISTDSILIPPMLLQPIIENAIEHNNWQNKEGRVTINFTLLDKHYIEISVTDNGIGLKNDEGLVREGSLSVIKESIELLNINYNKKGTITFDSFANQGLKVTIKVPYIDYE